MMVEATNTERKEKGTTLSLGKNKEEDRNYIELGDKMKLTARCTVHSLRLTGKKERKKTQKKGKQKVVSSVSGPWHHRKQSHTLITETPHSITHTPHSHHSICFAIFTGFVHSFLLFSENILPSKKRKRQTERRLFCLWSVVE